MKKLSQKEFVFIKNLFLTTVLGGIIGILNYFFNIFVARYTDSEVFGVFSSAIGIIYLLQIPASAIQAIITKSVAQKKDSDLNSFKWYSLGIFFVLGLAFSLIFFLSKNIISSIASIPVDTIFFLSLTFLFSFVSPIAKGLLLGQEKIGLVNIILLVETLLKFGIGLIAIKMDGEMSLLILANAIPALISSFVVLPLVKFKNTSNQKVNIDFKELGLVALSILLLTAPITIDLILVNPVFRADYASISLLGKLVFFASITTSAVMFARLTNEDDRGNIRKSLIISLGLSVSIGLVLSILYFMFSSYVISLTVGDLYLSIKEYIGIFGLCMTGFAFVYMSANFFISKSFFNYLYILFGGSALQVILFLLRNDSLEAVIQNQIVMYIFLTLGTLIYLLYKLRVLNNGKEEVEDIG